MHLCTMFGLVIESFAHFFVWMLPLGSIIPTNYVATFLWVSQGLGREGGGVSGWY